MTDATDYPLLDHVLHNLRSAILDIAHQPSRASESAFEGVERHQEWRACNQRQRQLTA